jgi:hypothetical protein
MMQCSYRSAPGLSGTDMAKLYVNPDLFFFERDPANAMFKRVPTPAMQFGTAAHLAILEPEEFEKRHVILRHVESYATKDGIAAKKEVQELIAERQLIEPFILKAIELASIRHMAQSFHKRWAEYNEQNFDALGDWHQAKKELAFFTEHEGVTLKGQIDILTTSSIVCDIKTTSAFEWFDRDIEKNGYDVQLTHYAKLADAIDKIVFFALESVPPFRCSVHARAVQKDKWSVAFSRRDG